MKPGLTMPWWVLPYVAGSVALAAFGHRDALRRRDVGALLAWAELLGSLCLAVPGLAYWGMDIVAVMGRTALVVLLALGCALVLAYLAFGSARTWRDPRLSLRQRRVLLLSGVAMAVLGNGLDAWWGAQALAGARG